MARATKSCLLSASILAIALTGCGGSASSPSERDSVAAPAPAAAAPKPSVPGQELAKAYAESLGKLTMDDDTKADVEFGFVLGSIGLRIDHPEARMGVAAICAQLKSIQPVMLELVELGQRDGRMSDLPEPGPHLSASTSPLDRAGINVRRAARLLNADAKRLFVAGTTDEAALRLAAGIGIVRQLSRSNELGAVTGALIFSMLGETMQTMATGAAGRRLSDADKATLRSALGTLDPATPFGNLRGGNASETATLALAKVRALVAE
jgi:hypothetical protein